MPLFVIFDRNAGIYHWGGLASDDMDALAKFDSDVGIDLHGVGLDALRKDFQIVEVTEEQLVAVEEWWTSGRRTSEFPL